LEHLQWTRLGKLRNERGRCLDRGEKARDFSSIRGFLPGSQTRQKKRKELNRREARGDYKKKVFGLGGGGGVFTGLERVMENKIKKKKQRGGKRCFPNRERRIGPKKKKKGTH